MKSSHQILSSGKIDSGFAADRRIDLRQKSRGYLNERQTPEVNCRTKTRQIADDSTAQRHHQIVPFKAIFTKKSDRFLQHSERFVTLTFGHQPFERLKPGSLQRTLNITTVKVEDPLVRDDSDATRSF